MPDNSVIEQTLQHTLQHALQQECLATVSSNKLYEWARADVFMQMGLLAKVLLKKRERERERTREREGERECVCLCVCVSHVELDPIIYSCKWAFSQRSCRGRERGGERERERERGRERERVTCVT